MNLPWAACTIHPRCQRNAQRVLASRAIVAEGWCTTALEVCRSIADGVTSGTAMAKCVLYAITERRHPTFPDAPTCSWINCMALAVAGIIRTALARGPPARASLASALRKAGCAVPPKSVTTAIWSPAQALANAVCARGFPLRALQVGADLGLDHGGGTFTDRVKQSCRPKAAISREQEHRGLAQCSRASGARHTARTPPQ